MSSDNPLKRDFVVLERNVLILIMIPLLLFSFAYLYVTAPARPFDLVLPALPENMEYLLLGATLALLPWQAVTYHKTVKQVSNLEADVTAKFRPYASAVTRRFWQLFVIGIFSAIGVLLSQNPMFTIAYAVCLVFISIGKPSPERIISALKLKGKEKDIVYDFRRRED